MVMNRRTSQFTPFALEDNLGSVRGRQPRLIGKLSKDTAEIAVEPLIVVTHGLALVLGATEIVVSALHIGQ